MWTHCKFLKAEYAQFRLNIILIFRKSILLSLESFAQPGVFYGLYCITVITGSSFYRALITVCSACLSLTWYLSHWKLLQPFISHACWVFFQVILVVKKEMTKLRMSLPVRSGKHATDSRPNCSYLSLPELYGRPAHLETIKRISRVIIVYFLSTLWFQLHLTSWTSLWSVVLALHRK